jgi:hypothetical protein
VRVEVKVKHPPFVTKGFTVRQQSHTGDGCAINGTACRGCPSVTEHFADKLPWAVAEACAAVPARMHARASMHVPVCSCSCRDLIHTRHTAGDRADRLQQTVPHIMRRIVPASGLLNLARHMH